MAHNGTSAPEDGGLAAPVKVYAPSLPTYKSLTLISPGAGGSEQGYAYLAEALRDADYLGIMVGYQNRGRELPRAQLDGGTLREDLDRLTTAKTACAARLSDIAEVMEAFSHHCLMPSRC